MLNKKPSKIFRQVEIEQSSDYKIKQPLDEVSATKKSHPKEETKHFRSSLGNQEQLNAASDADFKRFDSRSREQIVKLR